MEKQNPHAMCTLSRVRTREDSLRYSLPQRNMVALDNHLVVVVVVVDILKHLVHLNYQYHQYQYLLLLLDNRNIA